MSSAPAFRDCAVSFPCFGPLEIFRLSSLLSYLEAAGLAQPDCDRLLWVPHFASAAAFELPMLELVHDAADRFLLGPGLMSRHCLTPRIRLLQKIVCQAASVPDPRAVLFSGHVLASAEPIARVSR